ncbi:hypothetical protein [Ruania zhangjianzhongii]|uniref:hypothetical protein n=1 Tax=Ruania zhangjianzhongii TaxID=2603206 RepID=UPI0011CC64B0|nr:hypothetical protein [Ruania zhangjianzhongii]
MDTYADGYTNYRADLEYRREQLVAGLDAGRKARRNRRSLRSMLTSATPAGSNRPARSHFARSA